jgi:Tol biopolymer transport system component
MTRTIAAPLLAMGLALCPGPSPAAQPPDAPPDRVEAEFRKGVERLASDAMEGRGLGTRGIGMAAEWLEGEMHRMGLDPAFGSSYRQPFDVKVGVELDAGNRLDGVSDGDWTPLGFSSSGDFSGEAAFLGYGIESEEIGFTELKGIDLQGKVAIILRYEPQERDDASPFDGRRPSRWSAMRYKALQARERGAAAVVFVTGPLQDEGEDRIPVLRNDGPESAAGLPVLQVKTSVAAAWLGPVGLDLGAFQTAVDRDLTPRSVASTGLRVAGRVALKAAFESSWNVAGVIPGRGALAGESVVIGAHYDHLGMGGERSMKPNVEAIHNGADDNASGTAAALYAGERLASILEATPSHRRIVVALFSGEEVGLAGSSHFVKEPPVDLKSVAAMINLDMVGRLRDGKLAALGSESAPEWDAMLERAAAATGGLTLSSHGDGYGPSDQTSFYGAGVPVIHLFTGTHEEYHSPEDDASTINTEGGATVIRFTAELARLLAEGESRLTWIRSTAAPTMEGDSRGYGSYLGTIPDYTAMEATDGGVLLSDVRGGGPADLAGIRGGDRIISMAGTRIQNLYDMTYALQDSRPGETIEVNVIRDGGEVALKATLGDRAAMSRKATEGGTPHGGPAAEGTPGGRTAPAHGAPSAHEGAQAGGAQAGGAHGSPGAGGAGEAPGLPAVDPFYAGRPGAQFVIGAGSTFTRLFDGESRLTEIRQLTFGGENAEAYWSPDGKSLIYQATPAEGGCDQQHVLDLASGKSRLVSTGMGRTTCGYFDWPEADRIVYSSTHEESPECPPTPDHSMGYVWALHRSYEIYQTDPGGGSPRRLTDHDGYDAEATWCHRGGKLIFTSDRDGDLELYSMDEAGSVRRLTDTPGYDGGAFYSPDCSEIVWRASRPEGQELADYRELLGEGLIRPGKLEIFVMSADGTGARQITANGAANFCPAFTAEGSRIIYSSNSGPGGAREFDLWMVAKEGGEPERITRAPGFDGFPQFSPDGRWLVWASNRADPGSHETNIFVARWNEEAP